MIDRITPANDTHTVAAISLVRSIIHHITLQHITTAHTHTVVAICRVRSIITTRIQRITTAHTPCRRTYTTTTTDRGIRVRITTIQIHTGIVRGLTTRRSTVDRTRMRQRKRIGPGICIGKVSSITPRWINIIYRPVRCIINIRISEAV